MSHNSRPQNPQLEPSFPQTKQPTQHILHITPSPSQNPAPETPTPTARGPPRQTHASGPKQRAPITQQQASLPKTGARSVRHRGTTDKQMTHQVTAGRGASPSRAQQMLPDHPHAHHRLFTASCHSAACRYVRCWHWQGGKEIPRGLDSCGLRAGRGAVVILRSVGSPGVCLEAKRLLKCVGLLLLLLLA